MDGGYNQAGINILFRYLCKNTDCSPCQQLRPLQVLLHFYYFTRAASKPKLARTPNFGLKNEMNCACFTQDKL